MQGIMLLVVFTAIILFVCNRSHKKNVERLSICDKPVSFFEMDEKLAGMLTQYRDVPNFDYTFNYEEIPLGRASAFLNFFGKNIFTEEPYLFLCKCSMNDDTFREFGCIVGRTGAYVAEEVPGKKDSDDIRGIDIYIPFEGLVGIHKFGSNIIPVYVKKTGLFDTIKTFTVKNPDVANLIILAGKQIVANEYGLSLYKNLVVELPDEPAEIENAAQTIGIEAESISYDSRQEIRNTPVELVVEEYDYETTDDPKTRKRVNRSGKGFGIGVGAAGVQAVSPKFNAFWGELKNHMNGSRGHGYAAEYGNNTVDRLKGTKLVNAAQDLDSHGRQVKHGADRMINGIEVQTKYYKTASETIGAAFQHKQAIYLRSDHSGKMMQIEVPKDQYQEALKCMQKRIDSGQVPNVGPGESAKNYVRKGYFTYEQSFNIARAGTIESLSVDAMSGAVCCMQAAGIASVIIFAQAIWSGATPKEAMGQSLQTGLSIMGKGTLIYVLTMQLSRKEVANVFAAKVYTKDGICQGFQGINNPFFTASERMAQMVNSSRFASTEIGRKLGLDTMTGRKLIAGSVTVAVVFGPDVIRMLRGRISSKQLIKNSTIGAAGMAGAAAGQAIIPIPVVGAMAGGAVGGFVAKKVMDQFIEDDAKAMYRILKEEFIDVTMLSNLSKDEFDEVVDLTIASKKAAKYLRDMFQAEDCRVHAREAIMMPAVVQVMEKRKLITVNDYNTALLEAAEFAIA